jgi:hypothetical protein
LAEECTERIQYYWNTTKRGKLSPVLDSNRRDYTYYQQMQKFKDILQKYL